MILQWHLRVVWRRRAEAVLATVLVYETLFGEELRSVHVNVTGVNLRVNIIINRKKATLDKKVFILYCNMYHMIRYIIRKIDIQNCISYIVYYFIIV